MARIAPFQIGVLLPRKGGQPPATALSFAAALEEPDLVYGGPEGYARQLLAHGHGEAENGAGDADAEPVDGKDADQKHAALPRMTVAGLERDGLLQRAGQPGAVLAIVRHEGREFFGLYCNYPIRSIRELATAPASTKAQGVEAAAYREVCRREGALLDPLLLALSEPKPAALTAFANTGEEMVSYEMGDGVKIALRFIASDKDLRAMFKLFEPGLFGPKPDPMILDGPIALARELAASGGDAHIFACLVPVGDGGPQLDLNELLLHNAGATEAEGGIENPAAGERTFAPPPALPEGCTYRGYRYIDDDERAYVAPDWEEDLRIESRVADCAALLMRGRNEFGLVLGERGAAALGPEALYASAGIGEGAQSLYLRQIMPQVERAARAFIEGRGDAALWTPRHDRVDYTARILARRPPFEARRGMLRVSPFWPFGVVMDMGGVK